MSKKRNVAVNEELLDKVKAFVATSKQIKTILSIFISKQDIEC